MIWPNREADLLLTSQGSCQRSTGVLVGTTAAVGKSLFRRANVSKTHWEVLQNLQNAPLVIFNS